MFEANITDLLRMFQVQKIIIFVQFDMRDIDGLFAEPLKKFQFISVAAGSAIQVVGLL